MNTFTEPGRTRRDEMGDSEGFDETRTKNLEAGRNGRSILLCNVSRWAQNDTLARKKDGSERDRTERATV